MKQMNTDSVLGLRIEPCLSACLIYRCGVFRNLGWWGQNVLLILAHLTSINGSLDDWLLTVAGTRRRFIPFGVGASWLTAQWYAGCALAFGSRCTKFGATGTADQRCQCWPHQIENHCGPKILARSLTGNCLFVSFQNFMMSDMVHTPKSEPAPYQHFCLTTVSEVREPELQQTLGLKVGDFLLTMSSCQSNCDVLIFKLVTASNCHCF